MVVVVVPLRGAGEVKYGTVTLSSGSYVFRAGDGGPASGSGGPGTVGLEYIISSPLFPTITAAGGGGGGAGGSGAGWTWWFWWWWRW